MRAFPMMFAALLLAGCGSDAPSEPPNERKPTVFDDQLEAIDKAKAVEGDVMEAKERQDEDIDAATGGR